MLDRMAEAPNLKLSRRDLLKAAAAVKPAFARTFTAFGRYN